jgi:ribosomal protein L16 Arg81 hydroxylase
MPLAEAKEGVLGMSSEFLDNLTFPKLIAPISVETFLSEYWEQKPLVVHRNESHYYGDLLTVADFDRNIASQPYVKAAEATTKSNKRMDTDSTKGLETLLAEMWSGKTLVLDQLQQREPKLDRLCRVLQRELGYFWQTNCYLTPPKGIGFTPHWDNHDVFILQVFGSKHWKVENERRRLPGRTDFMADEEGRFVKDDAASFTLKQGDLIYIPRGVVHAAECGADPSLHVTLGVNPRTWEDLLNATISDLVKQDKSLQLALPPGYMNCPKDKLVKHMRAVLKRTINPELVSSAIDRFRDVQVTKVRPDISGQILDHFRPRPVDSLTVVRPRHGTVCTMYNGEDTVQLNYAGRSITFLGIFKAALIHALNTPSYTVGELPGDLEEEEKIALVERLMQEGLVVRA